MKKTKILLLLTLAIVVILGSWVTITTKFQTNETPKELSTIRLPVDIWPGNFWIIIAEKKGFFEEEGLKAELVDVSANYNEMVDDFYQGNTVDTQNLAIFDLVEANLEGADIVAVLMADSSEGAEGLAAKKEYQKLADLRGKRIGVEVGSYLDYFLEAAMLNADISSEEYTKVDIVTEDISDNFEKENLDAAFTWEPNLSKMEETYNLHTLFDTADIRGLSPGIFAFKRTFIENRPNDVQAVINAWNKATQFIQENKEEAYAIISQVTFADDPSYHYSYEELDDLIKVDPLQTIEDNIRAFGFEAGFESLHSNLQFVSRFIQKAKVLETMPNTNHMLTDQFIRDVK